ncbi:hypothetical protein L7F22_037128 [Adiantum nelumboides]|nr:hypothetical protein [Adiantum nelumboides]
MQQMMQQFAAYMQQQQTVQQQYQLLQEWMRKGCQVITDKLQRFEGRDICKFCRLYEQSMEDNGTQNRKAVDGCHFIVVAELRARIVELQAQQGTDSPEFKKSLKEEYFLEDSPRVTKQSFMKWINQKNKGLSTRELLQEFEKKYEQLSFTEQRSIRSERVELLVQAADARLQKSLVQLLKDATRLKNKTLKKDLHLKACSTFEQVTREALYLMDNCKVYGEVNEDANSVASGASSVKSETSTKKNAPAQLMPMVNQMIEEVSKRMQQHMRQNLAMRQPQMRKCDICGGDHPTPWCTQQPKAPVVNGRVLKWCAVEQKWTNHGIDECFYNKNYVREKPYGPPARPP